MRIDAHQHFWRVDRGDYGWLTREAFPAIYRDFLPDDLAPLLADCGVDRTILVQGAQTDGETEFLLDLAGATAQVAGVVGWADLRAADAPARIATLAGRDKLVGLRPMLQDLPEDAWILDPALAPGVQTMVEAGLRFDALVFPRHLPHLERFIDRHPELPVVIDHGAKPPIAAGEIDEWARQMASIARREHVTCKLSGLVTEAGSDWTPETLRPYVDVLLGVFGPARLMWGSDWPVLNLAGEYAAWFRIARALTSHLTEDEQDRIFGGTAAAFYGVRT